MPVPVVTIYRNGDLHFFGKKLVVNPKRISTFDNFLDKVTHDTQAKVAIRRICTPNHGTKILKLEQLEHGGVYVAVGPERFKRLQYDKLRSTHPLLQTKKTVNQNVRPVLHSRIHASARYQKVALAEPLKNRIVFVYRNGDSSHQGIKLLLDKHMLLSMNTVLQYITDKIKLTTGAVKSIHTLDGVEITETKDIVTGDRYVAVGYGKPFIKTLYNQNPPFSVTPRRIAHSKNSDSVESSPKYKTPSKLEKKDRKWRTHFKKSKEKSPTHVVTTMKNKQSRKPTEHKTQSKPTSSFFEQLTNEIDDTVDHVVDEYGEHTEFFQSSNEYKIDTDATGDTGAGESYDGVNYGGDIRAEHIYSGDSHGDEKKESSHAYDEKDEEDVTEKLARENTFDRRATSRENIDIQADSDDVSNLKIANDDNATSTKKTEERHNPLEADVVANKKIKSTGFGTTFEKPETRKSSVASDHLSDSVNIGKGVKSIGGDRRRSIDNKSKASTRQQSMDNSKSDIVTPRKSSVDNDTAQNNRAVVSENKLGINATNELSGTPPLTDTNEPVPKNLDQRENEEPNDGKEADDPVTLGDEQDETIFKASGEQGEKADQIKDNKDTRVEKTLDMQVAEEVEEEEIEGGEQNEDTKDDTEKERKI